MSTNTNELEQGLEDQENIFDDSALSADTFKDSLSDFFKGGSKDGDDKDKPAKVEKPADEIVTPVDKVTPEDKKDDKFGDEPKEEKAKSKWKELKEKAELADLREKEISDLKLKLEESGLTQARITELEDKIKLKETEIEEKNSRLMVTDLEQTDSYIELVTKPGLANRVELERIATAHGIKMEDIISAIDTKDVTARNRQLTELSEGMGRIEQGKFDQSVNGIIVALERAAELHANSVSVVEADKKKKSDLEATTKQQRKEEYQRASNAVFSTLSKKVGSLIDKSIVDDAKKNGDLLDLDTASPDIRAGAAYALQLIPHMTTQLEEKNARIKDLEAKLAKRVLGAATTTPSGGSDADEEDDKDEGIGSRFQKFARGA